MSKVSVQDVRHVAMLARLGVSDERATSLTREMNTILEHMDALGRVNTDGVPEYSAFASGQRLRPDQGPSVPLTATPDTFAPESRDGLLLVPRLATHEESAE